MVSLVVERKAGLEPVKRRIIMKNFDKVLSMTLKGSMVERGRKTLQTAIGSA